MEQPNISGADTGAMRAMQDALNARPEVASNRPQILEVGTQTQPAQPRNAQALQPLNRKQRRAREKQRRSKVFQKAEAKRVAGIQKQINEQLRLRREAEELQDISFADPRNITRVSKLFDPVVAALNSLVTTGEINAVPDGTPLMWVVEDGSSHPAAACLLSVVESYEKLSKVHGWNDHGDGLRRLAKRLELQMPVFQEDVDEALKTIEWMKFCTMTITPRQFTKEAVEIQIANELRDAGLAPDPTDADLTGGAE
jgi:hypothetical protein